MTNEEIIAKALEYAKTCEMRVENLHTPSVREAAVVHFQTQKPGQIVEVIIDTKTGEFLGATSPSDEECQIYSYPPRKA
jgi:hypothetical protein